MAVGQIIGRVSVKVMPDTADFREEAKRKLDRVEKQLPEVKAKVVVDLSTVKVAEINARLSVLTRAREVEILPKMNQKAYAAVTSQLAALSGARVFNNLLTDMRQFISNLDQSAPLIGTMAAAIAGLAGLGLTAASNLFALSSSLAQIGPAALLLPGILGGIAIGVGTMVAAFADFNKIFPDVKSKLSSLQDLISNNFWKEAEVPFRGLIDDIFPRLRAGLGQVSTQLGSFFGNLADSLKNILGPQLDSMFKGLSDSIEIFSTHTDALVGIITRLGDVGASRLPQLAGWFGDLLDRFDSFLAAADADGRLKTWIDNSIIAIKDLGSALGDIGGILAGISRAATAAGGSTLGMFADTLDRIHRTVDSAGFQKGLTDVFRAAHIAMENIVTQSGPAVEKFFSTLASLLTTVLPQAGNILGIALRGIATALSDPAVTNGILAMFNGLETAVRKLEPIMPVIGQALGQVATAIGALLPVIASVVANALPPLIAAFTQISEVLYSQVVPALGQALVGAIQAIAPHIPTIAAAFNSILLALVPLIPKIAELVPQFVALASQIIPPLAQILIVLANALIPVITQVARLLTLIAPVLIPVITILATLIADTLVFAINSLMLVLTGLQNLFTGVIQVITGIVQVGIGTWIALFTGDFGKVLDGLRNIWNGIVNLFQGFFQVILGAIGLFLSVGILGAFTKGFIALKAVFAGGWAAIKTVTVELFGSLTGLLKIFANGLKETPRIALAALRDIFRIAWSEIKTSVRLVFDEILSIIRTQMGSAIDFVKTVPGMIVAAFAGAGTLLLSIGRSIVEGLISGIREKASDLGGVIGGIKDSIVGGFKSALKINSPAKVMIPIGSGIVEGIEKGVSGRHDKLVKLIGDLTAKLPKGASAALKAIVKTNQADLNRLMTQWDKATDNVKAAKDKLQQLRNEAANYASNIASSIFANGDVARTEDKSFAGIIDNLKKARDEAQSFAAVLDRLAKLGLAKESIDQLASAGPAAALEAAKAIEMAGKAGIAQVNLLQKELAFYAGKVGLTASNAMYAQGINVAEGFVKGIESGRAAIEKQMLSIAKSMTNAIKKELGIKSPSRVMREQGRFTMDGLLWGLEDRYAVIKRSLSSFSKELGGTPLTAPSIGDLGSTAGWSAQLDGGGQSVNKTLNYYAAPGSSLGSEEDLFAATSRARAGW